MKRVIVVSTRHVTIKATLDIKRGLSRDETEIARDELAGALMRVASDVRYANTSLSRVRVTGPR